jgi:hypothetical protein
MKSLDEGLPHPKLEVLAGIQTRAPAVGGEHSRKEPFEKLMLLLFGTSQIQNFCFHLGPIIHILTSKDVKLQL